MADTLTEASRLAKRCKDGTLAPAASWPLEVPDGDSGRRPAVSCRRPSSSPPTWSPTPRGASPAANRVARGERRGLRRKAHSLVTESARTLATEHGSARPGAFSREDVVRIGPKRPPIAAGMRGPTDPGTSVSAGRPAPGDLSAWVDAFTGPRAIPGQQHPFRRWSTSQVSHGIGRRAERAGRGVEPPEAVPMMARGPIPVGPIGSAQSRRPIAAGPAWTARASSPEGGYAIVAIADDGTVLVKVDAGEVLDEVVLRSYCIGAVHQGLGWVRREGVAVDASGHVLDLTIRSFGVLPAARHASGRSGSFGGLGPCSKRIGRRLCGDGGRSWIGAGLPPAWPIEA